jgi:hypothetical protein
MLILSISAQSTAEVGEAEVLQLTMAGLALVVLVVLTAVVGVMVVAMAEQADILGNVELLQLAVEVEQVDTQAAVELVVALEKELVMPEQVEVVAELAPPTVEDTGVVVAEAV